MTEYKDRPFTNQDVVLDGNSYESCTMTDCRLVYRGGALPVLKNNVITGSTWAFEDAAQRTANFLVMLYAGGGAEVVDRLFAQIKGLPDAGSSSER